MEKPRKIVILEDREYEIKRKLSLTEDQIKLLEWLFYNDWFDNDNIKFYILDQDEPPETI